jgi:hypothetical protein
MTNDEMRLASALPQCYICLPVFAAYRTRGNDGKKINGACWPLQKREAENYLPPQF